MALYHGVELTLTTFYGSDVLWIDDDPSRRDLPYMQFVGGCPNEYCIVLRHLPKDELHKLISNNQSDKTLVACCNEILQNPESLCNMGLIMAPKALVEQEHGLHAIGFAYRETPDNEYDSGWRVFSGDETDDDISNPNNVGVYSYTTICNIDPDILKWLESPVGSIIERPVYTEIDGTPCKPWKGDFQKIL